MPKSIDKKLEEYKILLAKAIKQHGICWDCPSCGFNNAAGWPTCNFCFKDKPSDK